MRDRRWGAVYAYIQRPEISFPDRETGYESILENSIEIKVVVKYNNVTYVNKMMVHDEFLHQYLESWEVYAFVLNEMVESIDDEMEKYARNPPPPPETRRSRPW